MLQFLTSLGMQRLREDWKDKKSLISMIHMCVCPLIPSLSISGDKAQVSSLPFPFVPYVIGSLPPTMTPLVSFFKKYIDLCKNTERLTDKIRYIHLLWNVSAWRIETFVLLINLSQEPGILSGTQLCGEQIFDEQMNESITVKRQKGVSILTG